MEEIEKKALDEIPANQEFLLEILNKKPGWFFRYGGYIAIGFVLLMVILVFILTQ